MIGARFVVLLAAWFFSLTALAHHKPIQAIFLNPGFATESFWQDVDNYMQAAARQLDVELTIYHGNRDVELILKLGETIARNATPNQYVFLVNEKNTGQRLYDLISETRAKTFFVLNDLDTLPNTVLTPGATPEENQHYLGSLIPNNHWAGYHVAREMDQKIQASKPKKPTQQWLAISGDAYTPASRQREQGLRDYIADNPHITLLQTIYGEWQEGPAEEKATVLFSRHKNVDGLWTANDHMAFGAIKAMKHQRLTPGQDVIVGTFNSSERVLNSLARNEISALGAGHFMAGGWALILAFDHFHGTRTDRDDLSQRGRFFEIIRPNSIIFDVLKDHAWNDIRFSQFSRTLNPKWKGYPYQLVANHTGP